MLKFNVKEVAFYLFGTITIALGVVLVIKSRLGTGPWDTFFIVLARRIDFLTIGQSAILITGLLTLLTSYLRKNKALLLMIIPIFMVGNFIDLFDLIIFKDYRPEGLSQGLPYLFGLMIVPLGGTMLVITKYPAGVFEEATLLIKDLLKLQQIFPARMLLETFPVLVSLSLSWLWFQDNGAVSVGTLGFILLTGPFFQFYMKHLSPKITFKETL
jgi:uncharacterized membrane protein YczE